MRAALVAATIVFAARAYADGPRANTLAFETTLTIGWRYGFR